MSRQGWRVMMLGLATLSLAVSSAPGQEQGRDRDVTRAGIARGRPAHHSRPVLASPQSGPGVFATGQGWSPGTSSEMTVPITSIQQLLRLSAADLDYVYQSAGPGNVPVGRVRGRVIMYPGTGLAVPVSKVARLMWQGKEFRNGQPMAVNRFFGLPMIKADVYQGRSWLDGGPSLILDYSKTSRLYRPYRDEIREVAPGIFLGLMYSRTQPNPTFKMYFALEAKR